MKLLLPLLLLALIATCHGRRITRSVHAHTGALISSTLHTPRNLLKCYKLDVASCNINAKVCHWDVWKSKCRVNGYGTWLDYMVMKRNYCAKFHSKWHECIDPKKAGRYCYHSFGKCRPRAFQHAGIGPNIAERSPEPVKKVAVVAAKPFGMSAPVKWLLN